MLAATLLAALPTAGLADMTCAAFTALDPAGQAAAVAEVWGAAMGGTMPSGGVQQAEDDAAGGMMAGEMMDEGSGAMMPGSTEMDAEEMTAAAAEACADHPEMTLGAALAAGR
jgi:hypothetical protein